MDGCTDEKSPIDTGWAVPCAWHCATVGDVMFGFPWANCGDKFLAMSAGDILFHMV
jgi:hypothetical protein